MRSISLAFPLVLCTLLAGCGGPSPEAPSSLESPTAATSEAGPERGIIVGVRPLGTPSPGEARGATLAQVLRAANGPGAPGAAQMMEVVVRLERANRDVALVQPAGWRLGQRVQLTPGERPVLTVAGGGA